MMHTSYFRRRTALEFVAMSMLGIAAFSPSLGAQAAPNPATPPIPQIHTSASEEVEIAPDRAAVSLAVESRARTAAAAGAENARIQTAVLDTLRKLGIESRHIRTQG